MTAQTLTPRTVVDYGNQIDVHTLCTELISADRYVAHVLAARDPVRVGRLVLAILDGLAVRNGATALGADTSQLPLAAEIAAGVVASGVIRHTSKGTAQ